MIDMQRQKRLNEHKFVDFYLSPLGCPLINGLAGLLIGLFTMPPLIGIMLAIFIAAPSFFSALLIRWSDKIRARQRREKA